MYSWSQVQHAKRIIHIWIDVWITIRTRIRIFTIHFGLKQRSLYLLTGFAGSFCNISRTTLHCFSLLSASSALRVIVTLYSKWTKLLFNQNTQKFLWNTICRTHLLTLLQGIFLGNQFLVSAGTTMYYTVFLWMYKHVLCSMPRTCACSGDERIVGVVFSGTNKCHANKCTEPRWLAFTV